MTQKCLSCINFEFRGFIHQRTILRLIYWLLCSHCTGRINLNQKQCHAMSWGFNFLSLLFFFLSLLLLHLSFPLLLLLQHPMPKIRHKKQTCLHLCESFCGQFSGRSILQVVFPGERFIEECFWNQHPLKGKEECRIGQKVDSNYALSVHLTAPVLEVA